MKGTVKWYNLKKGYGFIKGEDEQDYFVHFSALGGAMLRENDKVSFDAADTDRGKQAQNVKLLEKGSERGERKRKKFDDEEESSENFESGEDEGYAKEEEQEDY